MKGENSLDRAKRLTRELEDKTEKLRQEASQYRYRISEIDKKIEELYMEKASLTEDLEALDDEKTDVLFTRLALAGFINSGGGLDMLPED